MEDVDLEELDSNRGLYLRQFWKVHVEVKLPQITVPGQSISNWDLMERLKKAVNPIKLECIRVRESSLETVTFEAELSTKSHLSKVIRTLEGMGVKVAGWAEPLRMHAKEARSDCPTRLDWDKYFEKKKFERDRPGLRPDTIHLSKVPANWFNDGIIDGPCERLLKKAFEGFGNIRLVDIPCVDPLRAHMPFDISGLPKKTSSFGPEVIFDGYVQFVEYDAFCKVMEKLKNKKWIKKTIDGRTYTANVKVDFDRNGHLSDTKLVARETERDRLQAFERRKREELEAKKKAEKEAKRLEDEEKEKRRLEREEKRRLKLELERRHEQEQRDLQKRQREEEKRLSEEMSTQSKRLLGAVFERLQTKENFRIHQEEQKLKDQLAKADFSQILKKSCSEEELRYSLLRQQEQRMRERLKKKMMAAIKRVRHDTDSSSSSSSSSSESDRRKKTKKDMKHKKTRKRKRSRSRNNRRR